MWQQPKPTLLLVDDDSNIVRFLTVDLHKAGFDVTVAQDGLEGLERANDHPGVIVTDVVMPRLDGLEMVRRLRTADHTEPIVVYSAASPGREEAALSAGATDYVEIPVDPEDFVRRVALAMDPRHL